MSYFVFKAVRGKRWPENWALSSEHAKIEDAEAAAHKLCRSDDPYTEPGNGLRKAFFGSPYTDRWSAMIGINRELT